MAANTPDINKTLLFLRFLLDCEKENYINEKSYVIELRQHQKSLDKLTYLIKTLEDSVSNKKNNNDSEIVMKVKELWAKHFGETITKDVKQAEGPKFFSNRYLGASNNQVASKEKSNEPNSQLPDFLKPAVGRKH